MVKRVLIVADLEGVAGVNRIDQIIAGTSGYAGACGLLSLELNVVVQRFLELGYEAVRISDSHRSGADAPNVRLSLLPESVELVYAEDAYAPEIFEDVSAVACIGMHAAARSDGFAAHTLDVHCDVRLDSRSLSEAHIVLELAAEAGIPVVFVSGDDVLQEQLGPDVRFVCTKTAVSKQNARSLPVDAVHRALAEAVGTKPKVPARLLEQPLSLHFKSAWQGRLLDRAGGHRDAAGGIEVDGPSFRSRYEQAIRQLDRASGPMWDAIRGGISDPEFASDAAALLLRAFPEGLVRTPSERIETTLRAFLRLTSRADENSVALRALTLHMLQGHAPRVFADLKLEQELSRSVEALAKVPSELPADLDPDVAVARIDAWYIRTQRGLEHVPPATAELAELIEGLQNEGLLIYGWLIQQMAKTLGVNVGRPVPDRPLKTTDRETDLYWLTHEVLLATGFLRSALPNVGWESRIEEILIATPWAIDGGHVDLAGEMALCLQVADEGATVEHAALVQLLIQHQKATGEVMDTSTEEPADERADHATGVALLVMAKTAELQATQSPTGR